MSHIRANDPEHSWIWRSSPRTLAVLTGELFSWSVCGWDTRHGEKRVICVADLTLVCVRYVCHLGGYQSKSVSRKWGIILPGWCSIHLFILWYEDRVWSSTHLFCAGFISQMYPGCPSFFWCFVVVYILLLVRSHIHNILCVVFDFFFKSQEFVVPCEEHLQ